MKEEKEASRVKRRRKRAAAAPSKRLWLWDAERLVWSSSILALFPPPASEFILVLHSIFASLPTTDDVIDFTKKITIPEAALLPFFFFFFSSPIHFFREVWIEILPAFVCGDSLTFMDVNLLKAQLNPAFLVFFFFRCLYKCMSRCSCGLLKIHIFFLSPSDTLRAFLNWIYPFFSCLLLEFLNFTVNQQYFLCKLLPR